MTSIRVALNRGFRGTNVSLQKNDRFVCERRGCRNLVARCLLRNEAFQAAVADNPGEPRILRCVYGYRSDRGHSDGSTVCAREIYQQEASYDSGGTRDGSCRTLRDLREVRRK